MSQRKVIIRTDASTREGEGCGVAFKSKIYLTNNMMEYESSDFVEKNLKTTDAETFAVLFALKEMKQYLKENGMTIANYSVEIESDCDDTVNRVRGIKEGNDIDKFINHYLTFYHDVKARWIPRSANTHVDAMAKSIFTRMVDEQ